MTYELTFQTPADATDYFSALDYRQLPVKGSPVFAARGWTDDGAPIITFARQHLANGLAYTFTERPRLPENYRSAGNGFPARREWTV